MTALKELGISDNQISALEAKNISTVEEFLRFFPLRYNDFSKETRILDSKEISCLIMKFVSIITYDNRVSQVVAKCEYQDKNNAIIPISVVWFHQPYITEQIRGMKGRKVLVCGNVTKNVYKGAEQLQIIYPKIFTDDIENNMVIHPIYSSIKGIKPWYIKNMFPKAFRISCLKDYYEKEFLETFHLPELSAALRSEHFPQSMEEVKNANIRFAFDDMLYFSLMNRKIEKELPDISNVIPKSLKLFEQAKKMLPYELTEDQEVVIDSLLNKMKQGKRVNGLIQGDVGCGKSIVCFLLAIALAENGYQTAIMAPSKVLASQHYDDLLELTKDMDINVSLAVDTAKMKKVQKKEFMENLENGKTDIVVGTTALVSQKLIFHNLGLRIVDEEHKFGVMQRKFITEKGTDGIHTLNMSATPIPRTLAKTIYSESFEVYTIHSMPAGRNKIQNCVTNNWDQTGAFLLKELKAGHQVYVVCPMINKNERMENVLSAEELYKIYQDFLLPYGYQVAAMTGKMKKAEMEQTIRAFKDNEIQVLIATSVIEVGVNVPNSTVIVIHNAERFGLAGLHQLRGRVGRGKLQGYCIFFSDDTENMRLKTISGTTNGFEIAAADLEMRQTGDLLHGMRQSGKNKYIDLILKHKEGLYPEVKRAMAWLEEREKCEAYLKAMCESYYIEAKEL